MTCGAGMLLDSEESERRLFTLRCLMACNCDHQTFGNRGGAPNGRFINPARGLNRYVDV